MLTYNEIEAEGNYWLGKDSNSREEFILDLCEPEIIRTLRLVNTHHQRENPSAKRATNEFKVYLSSNSSGPWTEVLHSSFVDPHQETGHPVLDFTITPSLAQYVRFEMHSYHGDHGGGLQHFAAIPGQH